MPYGHVARAMADDRRERPGAAGPAERSRTASRRTSSATSCADRTGLPRPHGPRASRDWGPFDGRRPGDVHRCTPRSLQFDRHLQRVDRVSRRAGEDGPAVLKSNFKVLWVGCGTDDPPLPPTRRSEICWKRKRSHVFRARARQLAGLAGLSVDRALLFQDYRFAPGTGGRSRRSLGRQLKPNRHPAA